MLETGLFDTGKGKFTYYRLVLDSGQELMLDKHDITEVLAELADTDFGREWIQDQWCDNCEERVDCGSCESWTPDAIRDWLEDNIPDMAADVADEIVKDKLVEVVDYQIRAYFKRNACFLRGL